MRRSFNLARYAFAVAIILFGTGCDFDIIGPIDWSYSPGGGTYTPSEVTVRGSVKVGSYPAQFEEAIVRVYRTQEAHPQELVDSGYVSYGAYFVSLGASPGTAACDYWLHVERWDGEELEPVDLIPSIDGSCTLQLREYPGASVDLPDYEPLAEPFRIHGQVFVDGDSTAAAGIDVEIRLRPEPTFQREVIKVTDAAGRWSHEVTTGAERYYFCREARAAVEEPGGGMAWTTLDGIHPDVCGTSRELRPVRFGQTMAAVGRAYRNEDRDEWAGAGQVRLQLLNPADSTAYGEPVLTSDDGVFELWRPVGDDGTICPLLLRAEMVDMADVDPVIQSVGGCGPGLFWVSVDFEL